MIQIAATPVAVRVRYLSLAMFAVCVPTGTEPSGEACSCALSTPLPSQRLMMDAFLQDYDATLRPGHPLLTNTAACSFGGDAIEVVVTPTTHRVHSVDYCRPDPKDFQDRRQSPPEGTLRS